MINYLVGDIKVSAKRIYALNYLLSNSAICHRRPNCFYTILTYFSDIMAYFISGCYFDLDY